MEITIISPSPHLQRISAYGVRILSACLKQIGCDVKLIFMPRQVGEVHSADVLDQIVALAKTSDLIGMSLMTDDLANAIPITQRLKQELSVPIIWGGVHPTIEPEESLKYADMVCIGEGEGCLVELVERMRTGEDYRHIPGTWQKEGGKLIRNPRRPLIQDLDRFPLPDLDLGNHFILWDGKIQPVTPEIFRVCLKDYYLTLTSRGCPFQCTYCWNHAFSRIYAGERIIRQRSVENVIAELRIVKERFPYVELICIDDDAFFLRTDEDIEEFSTQYREQIQIPMWVTGATPTTLTERKLAALANAGMTTFRMGIQTGSQRTKKLYRRTHSNQAIRNAVSLIHKFRDRINRPQYDIILDNPWETPRDLRTTLRFLSRLPVPYELFLFPLVFYPGTDLFEKARREGKMPAEESELERIRYHRFKPTFLNSLFFLLNDYARRGWCISPVLMFLLTSPLLIRLGASQLLYLVMRKRLEGGVDSDS
jgi:anaerobic magnesium-protoporphyrin IX monomethyl ester cyclase